MSCFISRGRVVHVDGQRRGDVRCQQPHWSEVRSDARKQGFVLSPIEFKGC